MKIIKRKKYLEQIKPFIGKSLVKVLIGQRRSGKSSILLSIIEELKKNGEKTRDMIYINKELIARDHIKNYNELYETVKKYKIIMIDEIQDIENWEKAIRSLQAEGKHDIYITGSNAQLLSGELATYLGGRYIHFEIYPLDYKEFLMFHKKSPSKEIFLEYMKYGGLPYLINLGLSSVSGEYLKDVYNTIIVKDIISKYNIRNIGLYEKLIQFIAHNTGSIFSAKSISDFLKAQKINLQPNMIIEYLNHSQKALFLQQISRYDIKGKKVFENREKYFFTDHGLRNSIVGGFSMKDINGILENIVCINLLSHGWKIYVGETGEKEIDFVAEKNGEKMYIQIAYVLEHKTTFEREINSLKTISDNRPKYIITMDALEKSRIDGIHHINIADFILELK